jgi:hypothetical protein
MSKSDTVDFCGAGVLGIEVFGVDGCYCTLREELPEKLLLDYIKVEE